MLRWLNPLRGLAFGDDGSVSTNSRITDDPLAALNTTLHGRRNSSNDIYAVSRLNPLYLDETGGTCLECPKYEADKPTITSGRNNLQHHHRRGSESPPSAGKSSGYVSQLNSRSDSSHSDVDPIYSRPTDIEKLEDYPTRSNSKSPIDPRQKSKYLGSVSSSTGFILTTIPEGKVDFSIPRPVWPGVRGNNSSDSDDSLNIYSSLNNYVTQLQSHSVNANHSDTRRACARDLLRELSKTLTEVVEGKNEQRPEDVLKGLNTKISQTLEVLQTENDIRNLSHIISSGDKLRTVSRALSHNSSDSPLSDWDRIIREEEVYHEPSGVSSASSGFSDVSQIFKNKNLDASSPQNPPPVFVHKNLSSISNGVRNAMIYGTLCRGAQRIDTKFKLIDNCDGAGLRSVREISHSDKPSVWEHYYGAGFTNGDFKLLAKPTDTPAFPAGRPEADFTLDVPRAELLMRRMKADKRWRCKCRIITSLLGLIFFLLTVMAVSLMLTNGKKMFGSMF
ncbi:uncharacterized protein LOC123298161 isoform X2 [Chrysoperla carnea]|uniref:uncharacterized protein LOC123298161 isoform X2 n=1 Tax=Chrysoperla carnea TaxID=189513 RepID=UPI001D0662CF|nr:uncharacterized protein LOC123298161 isoform X2 [Chrysoperla carnea]